MAALIPSFVVWRKYFPAPPGCFCELWPAPEEEEEQEVSAEECFMKNYVFPFLSWSWFAVRIFKRPTSKQLRNWSKTESELLGFVILGKIIKSMSFYEFEFGMKIDKEIRKKNNIDTGSPEIV